VDCFSANSNVKSQSVFQKTIKPIYIFFGEVMAKKSMNKEGLLAQNHSITIQFPLSVCYAKQTTQQVRYKGRFIMKMQYQNQSYQAFMNWLSPKTQR
jgi:hypothetical protein